MVVGEAKGPSVRDREGGEKELHFVLRFSVFAL
jgi:hypothetical protein